MENFNGYEVAQVNATNIQILDPVEKANVDTQVSTAKQYPRDLQRVLNNVIALVTADRETAQSCSYSLPRGGKSLTGPTVHLAKMLAQQYGNMRVESKVVDITDKQVVSRGTCWDLENNVAVSFEVRRSIMSKSGRFNDDMITVTGNAANAIAYRNAVLSLIPKSIIDSAYKKAQEMITGDLSDETKVIQRRTKAIEFFNSEYGITEEEVIKLMGKQTIKQIKVNEIATLLGIQQSLADGDTTVEDLMKPIRLSKDAKKEALKKVVEETNNTGKGKPKEDIFDGNEK